MHDFVKWSQAWFIPFQFSTSKFRIVPMEFKISIPSRFMNYMTWDLGCVYMYARAHNT